MQQRCNYAMGVVLHNESKKLHHTHICYLSKENGLGAGNIFLEQ